MAKKNDGTDDGGTISSGAPATVGDLAEDLGRLLGESEKSLRGWLGQRDAFIKNLIAVRDRANKLLAEAGHKVQDAAAVVKRRGRPPGTKKQAAAQWHKPSKKKSKKGGMSAAGKARVSAAQKARWEKIREHKVVTPEDGGDKVGNR